MNSTNITEKPRVRGGIALLIDVACVLAFCAVGRRSHAEGVMLAGWLVVRAWRRPTALVPTGLTVWIATVAGGMLLRAATGGGVTASFIAVASTVTALLLLGWRLLSRLTPGRS